MDLGWYLVMNLMFQLFYRDFGQILGLIGHEFSCIFMNLSWIQLWNLIITCVSCLLVLKFEISSMLLFTGVLQPHSPPHRWTPHHSFWDIFGHHGNVIQFCKRLSILLITTLWGLIVILNSKWSPKGKNHTK